MVAYPASTALIYDALRRNSGASRTMLAQETGFSLPTISSVIDEFIKMGLVKEVGYGDSSRGRRPRLLEIVPEARYAVAVDLGRSILRCALVDLAGQIVEEVEGCAITPTNRDQIGDEIASIVIRSFGRLRERILGVGIATPGVTEPDTGRFHLAPALGYGEISIKEHIVKCLQLPTFVENEANAAALGEITFGSAKGADPFVFISSGTGIGAGIIVRNEIIRGYGFAAGEIGYLVVDKHWTPKARYGFGCFESLASENAILERVTRGIREGYPSQVGRLKACSELNFDDIVTAVREGDTLAAQVLEDIIEYFAIGLANIVAVISPQRIIIGGGLSKIGDKFLLPMKERLDSLVPNPPSVSLSKFGDKANLIGAATLVIEGMKERLLAPAGISSSQAQNARGGVSR